MVVALYKGAHLVESEISLLTSSNFRLAEIAHSLLKLAPYDTQTMESRGLRRYIMEMLPITDWTAEAVRPALILILKRLDRMFNKIHKMPTLRWACMTETYRGPFLLLQALKEGYVILLTVFCCTELSQQKNNKCIFPIVVYACGHICETTIEEMHLLWRTIAELVKIWHPPQNRCPGIILLLILSFLKSHDFKNEAYVI